MIETATHDSLPSLLTGRPLPPSERGPLARFHPTERVCHRCRRRLPVKGNGKLSIERVNRKVQITCGRCLGRTRTRDDAFEMKMRELQARHAALHRRYG
jgi:hypothetical protein